MNRLQALRPGNWLSARQAARRPRAASRRAQVESLEQRSLLTTLVWGNGPSLPAARGDVAAVVSPANDVMVMGGNSTVVNRWFSNTNAWTAGPALPQAAPDAGVARLGSQIIVFGGRNGQDGNDQTLSYDYLAGDSQDLPTLSRQRYDFAYAADSAFQAYAIGGLETSSGPVLSSVERFDPVSDTWSDLPSLPVALHGSAGVADGAGGLYVFGGATNANGSALVNNSYRYDIDQQTWQAVAPLPTATRDSSAVMDENGLIYVVGGISQTGTTSIVQVYNPDTNQWSIDAPLPQPVAAAAATVDTLGRLVVAGGYSAPGVASANVYVTQRLGIPDSAPLFTSSPMVNASTDKPYTYDANATGNPPAVFSLTTAPAGMQIDATSGLVTWQPVMTQLGQQIVTIHAVNRAGAVDQTFTISVIGDSIPPTSPTNLVVTDVTTTSISLSWNAATDNVGVDHYDLYEGYGCGWRNRNTCYRLEQATLHDTQYVVTGLTPLTTYKYAVRAVDAQGNSSGNSNLVSMRTQSVPVLGYGPVAGVNGPNAAVAKHAFALQLYASGNPAPTFGLAAGPSAMTVNPVTGRVDWTPTPDDVGTLTVTFTATNSEGTGTKDVTIVVQPDLPVLSFALNPTTGGPSIVGTQMEIQTLDASFTTSTYELVSAPSGMTIDAQSGLITWLPTVADAGNRSVTVRATNAAGATDKSLSFQTYFAGAPTHLNVTGLDTINPVAHWTTPSQGDVDQIAGYRVVATRRYRAGRFYRTEQYTFDSPGQGTELTMSGLGERKTFNLIVTPYDSQGNYGVASTEAYTFTPLPALPQLTYNFVDNDSSVVAGRTELIQLTDATAAQNPSTFSIVSAPAGLTLDAVTGLATWTPTAADAGTRTLVLRATNSVGPRDVSILLYVYFSDPVVNATAVTHAGGGTANVTWSPPLNAAGAIQTYRLTHQYSIGGRMRTTTYEVAGGTTSFVLPLIPTGAVWHRGVIITPVDANGNAGMGQFVPFT